MDYIWLLGNRPLIFTQVCSNWIGPLGFCWWYTHLC